MTTRLSPPARFTDESARAFIEEVVAVFEEAGLAPYWNAGFAGSSNRGLVLGVSNSISWGIHDPDAGSQCQALLSKPRNGEASMGVGVWGTPEHNRLYHEGTIDQIDTDATDRMAERIRRALFGAGLRVGSVQRSNYDAGFGVCDVHFEVRFEKGA